MKAYSLADAMQKPDQVSSLYLHKLSYAQLPEAILQLKNLRVLEVSESGLTVLPEWLAGLEQLEALHLPDNQIGLDKFPFAKLYNLKQLDLSRNSLHKFPMAVLECENLQYLKLAGNTLRNVPKEIAKLSVLQIFDICKNKIKKLPDSIGKLQQLREFNCAHNQLSLLPDALVDCQQLQKLDCSNNRLKEIPLLISLSNLTNLDLSNNKLTSLFQQSGGSEIVFDLQHLRELKLSNNKLTSLPDQIGEGSAIRRLYADRNNLQSVPKSIGDLQRLERLHLQFNKLQELPESMASLLQLRELILSNNQLQDLLARISQWKHLRKLDLQKNPINVDAKKLLSLDHLEFLKGLENSFNQKKMLRFLKICRKYNVALSDRNTLYKLWLANEEENEKLPLPALINGLKFPVKTIRDQARLAIINRQDELIRKPLSDAGSVYITGKVRTAKHQLIHLLGENGIHYTQQLEDDITHIVLGDQIKNVEEIIAQKVTFVSEQALLKYLRKLQKDKIDNNNKLQLNNLSALLLSRDDRNIAIAIRILINKRVPENLFTDIFLAYKSAKRPALRKSIRQLLELEGDDAVRKALSFRGGLGGKLSKERIAQNIQKLAELGKLDKEKIEVFYGMK